MAEHRITEAELQQRILHTAALYGWRVAHFRPARTAKGWRTPLEGDAGFPDLVLARDGTVIVAELKSARGRTTPDQDLWLEHLGDHAVLWRPGDWPTIQNELRRHP